MHIEFAFPAGLSEEETLRRQVLSFADMLDAVRMDTWIHNGGAAGKIEDTGISLAIDGPSVTRITGVLRRLAEKEGWDGR